MPHKIQQVIEIGLVRELCDRNLYREASEALGPYQEDPEWFLAAGMVESGLGAMAQLKGAQERAKDFFTTAERLFPEGPSRRAEALGRLALSYWRLGEHSEALITVDEALRIEPDCPAAILTKAVIQTDKDDLADALLTLLVSDLDLWEINDQGRNHGQRALIYKKRAEKQNRTKAANTRDKAIIEYEAATVCFEQGRNSSQLATVSNNLAGLYLDCRLTSRAHICVDRAIGLWTSLQDLGCLAQAFDTKARIYLKEHKAPPALEYAAQSTRLLQQGEQSAWLAAVQITYKRAELMKHDEDGERELIRSALSITEGSTTKAAILLGLSQPGLAFKLKTQYPELLPFRKTPRVRNQKHKHK